MINFKKKIKNIISLFLITVLIAAVPFSVSAEENLEIKNTNQDTFYTDVDNSSANVKPFVITLIVSAGVIILMNIKLNSTDSNK